MKRILAPLRVYCLTYFTLLALMAVLLLVYPKLELHLMMNACHNSFLDTFFKYYSPVAEGPIYVLGLLPLFWKKYRITAFFAVSELSSGAVLQILKHTISMERPMSVFENYPSVVLPLVEGVDMHHGNSFPSGHASTFFVFATCSAILLAYYYTLHYEHKGSRWQIAFSLVMVALVVLAALGAYSRVYLSQHFLADVCMGSLIGFVTPFLVCYLGRKKRFPV